MNLPLSIPCHRLWVVEWRPNGRLTFYILDDEGEAKGVADDIKSKGHRACYWEIT